MHERIDLGKGVVGMMRKSRRARRLSITLKRDGSIMLTLPLFVSYEQGRVFFKRQATWVHKKIQALSLRPESILLRGSAKEYRTHRETARKFVAERIVYFRQFSVVSWKRISIRNQKTRWGSCSRSGNLSFNYRLLFLPPHLSDYVIVHELCHLSELNHSPKFWALVARTFPDYEKLRQELRLL